MLIHRRIGMKGLGSLCISSDDTRVEEKDSAAG